MLVGGWGRPKQRFNRTAAGVSATMLTLAAIALVMPAVFDLATVGHLEPAAPAVLPLSLLVSAVLLAIYGASLVFSLITHRELLTPVGHAEEAPPRLARRTALLMLGAATVVTAVEAELLVGGIEAAGHAIGLSEFFIGMVIVAVVGNAAEHFAAVVVARQDKMALAVTIAITSGTQIALLVAPIAVFASLLLGHPMPLVFNAFELAAIVLAVLVVSIVALDGESNWFEGLQLLAVYLIMVFVFLFVPA
jgi:Ca2+:H+ antiporter